MLSCMRTSELETECVFCHKEKTAVWFFSPLTSHSTLFHFGDIFFFKKNLLVFSHPGSPFRLSSDSAVCDSGGERCAARGQYMNYLSIYNVQDITYNSNRLRHKWFPFPLFLPCHLGQRRVNTSERTCDVDVVHIS